MKRDKHKPCRHWSRTLSCAMIALALGPCVALADDDDERESSSSGSATLTIERSVPQHNVAPRFHGGFDVCYVHRTDIGEMTIFEDMSGKTGLDRTVCLPALPPDTGADLVVFEALPREGM